MESLEKRVAMLERRVFRLLQPGEIELADYTATPPLVRVRLDDRLSDWVPFVGGRAGNDKSWWPPEVGEQVMVLSPNGEALAAVALAALYHEGKAAPGDRSDVARLTFADGALFEYDRAANLLHVSVPGDVVLENTGDLTVTTGGDMQFTASGSVAIKGSRIDLN